MKQDADFGKSLDIGLEGEKLLDQIAEAYRERGEDAVEVKNDQKVSETGYVYIERESRGKASGIDASNSPYWAIVLDGDKFKREVIVIIKTERLREICQHSDSGDVPGGGSDTSRGYLISPEKLVKSLESICARRAEGKAKLDQQSSYLDTPAARPEAAAATPPQLGSELEQLKMKWKQIIEEAPAEVKRSNAVAILRSAGIKPVAFEDDTVVLAFKYNIHKENMEKLENKKVAEKIVSNFIGRSCRVRCIHEPEDGHLLQAALKMGAQIVGAEER